MYYTQTKLNRKKIAKIQSLNMQINNLMVEYKELLETTKPVSSLLFYNDKIKANFRQAKKQMFIINELLDKEYEQQQFMDNILRDLKSKKQQNKNSKG